MLFVVVGLWACYYYRYGYQERKAEKAEREAKQKAEKAEREAKQKDNILFGTPIEPKHANPKLKRWGISDPLRRFFADFHWFGVIAAASPCCGSGPGAFIGAFFVTGRFALVLVTRLFGAVLAATRWAILVRAARLGALPRLSVAFRVAPRFFG